MTYSTPILNSFWPGATQYSNFEPRLNFALNIQNVNFEWLNPFNRYLLNQRLSLENNNLMWEQTPRLNFDFSTNLNSDLSNIFLNAYKNSSSYNFERTVTRTDESDFEPIISKTDIVDTGKLDKNFLDRVKLMAKNLNCDYNDLLALINSESSFQTTAGYKNGKIGCAVGLLQFTQPAIDELNKRYGLSLTKEKILEMSAIEQLDLGEKYLKIAKSYSFSDNHKLTTAELYTITFLPGRADREVLCQKGENYYAQNSGLDLNKDNKITQSELAQRLDLKRVDESRFMSVA